MSEFKFACPICGQHITADPASAGSQLECPTCYRKIIVPQAPSSTDPKFILSAAEASKPRPPQTIPSATAASSQPARTSPLVIGSVVFVLVIAGAALVVFHGKIFGRKQPAASQLTSTATGDTGDDDSTSGKKTAAVPPATNNIAWNLDLSQTTVPETPAAGKLSGEFVSLNRNTLTGGALSFRQNTHGLPDLSVTIYFFAKQPEELSGKTISINTNDSPAPRVAVRRKEGRETKSQFFTSGYALNLEMGDLAGGRITGKFYLALPDDEQSRAAGTFTAEIRKPAPPKPRAPKHN